ncbi:MAG: hypothetical protein ACLQDQ_15360 [Myxococcaceae bacterium]
MRRAYIPAVLCLSLAFVGCGTSTSVDLSTATTACNSVSAAACNRASSCGSLPTGTTVATCTTATETALDCAAGCAQGTTYHMSQAQTCLNDTNSATCGSNNLPTSCSTVCS